jgi:hypothetical protein
MTFFSGTGQFDCCSLGKRYLSLSMDLKQVMRCQLREQYMRGSLQHTGRMGIWQWAVGSKNGMEPVRIVLPTEQGIVSEISSSKIQIPKKFQISKFRIKDILRLVGVSEDTGQISIEVIAANFRLDLFGKDQLME